MSASLGATTYTSVTWTTGDTITEAKLDNMVANDQAYDSHALQGLLLNNNKSFAGKNAASSANLNLVKLNSSDELEFGDSDIATPIKKVNGSYGSVEAYTPAAAGTSTLDLAKSNVHAIAMPAGNITIALTHVKVGQSFIVRILQDGVGSRTVTWFETIKWAGGAAPALTITASKADVFGFICTSADNYDGFVVGQDL
jgi:hypothetical protein